jgi:hypothetical protein
MYIDGFKNCIELIVEIFPVNVNFSMLASMTMTFFEKLSSER